MTMRFTLLILMFTLSLDAAAYLDPGTGSLLLQGLIAGIAVVGFTIKTYWYKLRSLFGKAPQQSLLDDDETESTDPSK